MKKLFSLLTLAGAFALLPLNSATAHDSSRDGRLVGYTPCGKPIYSYHEVVGRDRCGRHIWEWVTHYPSSCHCRESHRDYGYGSRCESGRGYYRPGSGWSFNFRF